MSLITLSNLLTRVKSELKPVVANVERILSPITNFTRANPLISGVVLGTAATGTTTAVVGAVRKRSKRKSTRKKTYSKRRKRKSKKTRVKRRVKRKKKKRWYGKTRSKKIKYTKNGQPYVILKSGKARFIKRSRAKSMKKRKGGYS